MWIVGKFQAQTTHAKTPVHTQWSCMGTFGICIRNRSLRSTGDIAEPSIVQLQSATINSYDPLMLGGFLGGKLVIVDSFVCGPVTAVS